MYCIDTYPDLSHCISKMSMEIWLRSSRTIGGEFIRRIIRSNLRSSPYQATAASSSFSLLLNDSVNGKTTNFVFRYSYSCHSTYAASSGARRYNSMKTGEQLLSEEDDDEEEDDYELSSEENQGMDFPGGKITYTTKMNFLPGTYETRVQCYRVLDEDGNPISSIMSEPVSKEVALKVYKGMVTLNTMDKYFYEAQRQGRLSFYLTSSGEEAINLASAAALSSDDVVLTQYREPRVLLWRGFTVEDFANQCFGNNAGHGRGRQMPIHYGSNKLNYITISSPLATQLPQAVGMAYSLKMDKKDSCVVAFFGDGTTSEGDFHAALNFAAVLDIPVVFVCRNNGWAISTPVTE